MALLSRVADRIFWAARYIERAEDSARVLRTFGDMLADLSTSVPEQWLPLVSVAGGELVAPKINGSDEIPVVNYLIADREHPNSIVMAVESSRENLRTCREVLPREAWQTINDLNLYVRRAAGDSISRRAREPFLTRVVNDSRRLDGTLNSSMSRDEAYEMWRLGRYTERADMTTRVLGVRASRMLTLTPGEAEEFAEVRWMSVLRSLSALQMFQRASNGPVDGVAVLQFLLFDHRFPRSVAGCLSELRSSALRMPSNENVLHAVESADRALRDCRPAANDGAALDAALDQVQSALAELSDAIRARYGHL